MYDIQRIGKIIGDLNRFQDDLAGLNIRTVRDLNDKKNFYSASMLLFSILNRCIDLGEEIVTAKNVGTPATYRDIFVLLGRKKIIPPAMEQKLSSLMRLRNALAHEYEDFSEKDVFEGLRLVGVVSDFIIVVKALLKNEP